MTLEEKINELGKRRNELYDTKPRTPAEDQEKERVTHDWVEALRQQAKPLLDEVLQAGIRIESVWDFVNTADKYAEAIPVLIRHLSKPYHSRTKEGIVRALAVKEARGIANKEVIAEYRNTPKENDAFRWAFGNTMAAIATEDDLDDLVEIVLDENNGDSRRSFVEALGKLKSPRVVEVLKHLVNDESSLVSEAARKALKKKQKHL